VAGGGTAVAAGARAAEATPGSGRFRSLLIAALLAPACLVIGSVFLYPVLTLARMSLNRHESGGAMIEAVTAASYVEVLTDPFYHEIALNTVALAGTVTLCALLVAYPIALFLYRWESPWRGPLAVLTISPLLVSAVVRTYGWLIILGDQGWLNNMLIAIGAIGSPVKLVYNQTGVVVGLTEVLTPYMALSLIAGFGRLDRAVEEAAMTLGAGPLRTFWRVTLPLSLPGILLGCMLCFVLTVSSFVTPRLLGGGRVFTLATEIYDQATEALNWPLAAAISILMLTLFGVTLVAYGRLLRMLD